mgnify:CR=1 FL=1
MKNINLEKYINDTLLNLKNLVEKFTKSWTNLLNFEKHFSVEYGNIKNKIVVFGFNRMARSIKELIKEKNMKFIVIDRSPERLKKAELLGATVVYGDLRDNDILKGRLSLKDKV